MILRSVFAIVVAGAAACATAAPVYSNLFRESATTSKGNAYTVNLDGTGSNSSYDLADKQTFRFGNQFFTPLNDAKSDNEIAAQSLSEANYLVSWQGSAHAQGAHSQNSKGLFGSVDEGTAATTMELTIELTEETPFSISWATKGATQQDSFGTNDTFGSAALRVLTNDTEVFSLIHDSANLNKTTTEQLVLPAGRHKLIADVSSVATAFLGPILPTSGEFFADVQANLTFAPAPEPSTALLALFGVAGLAAAARQKIS